MFLRVCQIQAGLAGSSIHHAPHDPHHGSAQPPSLSFPSAYGSTFASHPQLSGRPNHHQPPPFLPQQPYLHSGSSHPPMHPVPDSGPFGRDAYPGMTPTEGGGHGRVGLQPSPFISSVLDPEVGVMPFESIDRTLGPIGEGLGSGEGEGQNREGGLERGQGFQQQQ